MLEPDFTAGYCETSVGVVHYRRTGVGPPIVLLHQGGSSSREPVRLARALAGWTAVLPDIPGHGASAPAPNAGITHYAQGIVELVEALNLEDFVLFGHHFGGVVAVEVAARSGHRVRHLVLSNTPFVDEAARELRARGGPRSLVADRPDGSHLTELWARRSKLIGDDVPLVNRYIAETLLLGEDVEVAHKAVAAYRMENRHRLYPGRTTYIHGDADPYAEAEFERSVAGFKPHQVHVISGGTVALVDQHPRCLAEIIQLAVHGEEPR